MEPESRSPQVILEFSTASLKDFYCVMTAIALGYAVGEFGKVVTANGTLLKTISGWDGRYSLTLLIVFIGTIIPFYHGAVRYMDTFTLSGIRSRSEQKQFIADFFMLFSEGSIFIAMGMNVSHLLHFVTWFVSLIVLDTCWAFWVRRCITRGCYASKPDKDILAGLGVFLGLNAFVGIPLFLIVLYMLFRNMFIHGLSTQRFELNAIWAITFITMSLRTYLDYYLGLDWYAPLTTGEAKDPT